jgi:integrase
VEESGGPGVHRPQFDKIYDAIQDEDFRLLVEVETESGLRWGELTELRAKDIDLGTCILTVSRAVVQVNSKFHPEGKRFLVEEYPKDKEYRRFKLGAGITAKIKDHIELGESARTACSSRCAKRRSQNLRRSLTSRSPQLSPPRISGTSRAPSANTGRSAATQGGVSASARIAGACTGPWQSIRSHRSPTGTRRPAGP